MSQNIMLDPQKRDYVFENGSPVPTDRVLEPSYFALMIPQGQWINGEPNEGSRIYTLQNRKRSKTIEQEFAAYAREAITRQVIDTGKASSVSAFNLQTTREGTLNEVDVVPAETQLAQQLDFVSV